MILFLITQFQLQLPITPYTAITRKNWYQLHTIKIAIISMLYKCSTSLWPHASSLQGNLQDVFIDRLVTHQQHYSSCLRYSDNYHCTGPQQHFHLLYSGLAIQLLLNYWYTIAITIFMNDLMITANYSYQLQLPQQC